MTAKLDNVVRLRNTYEGAFEGLRSKLHTGRYEIVTNGPNSEFGFIGSDPYGTNAYTGLVVPQTPSGDIGGARYLFLLARASFGVGERSPDKRGVRLVGIRQYAELIARLPARVAPLATDVGPPEGSTVTFRREILSPFWHPPDGDISWHVMILAKGQRDTRNPSNTDGVIYEDALSPALLYETITGSPSAPTAYTAPNGGRPWGSPIVGGSLGNIHELRYPWRTDRSERVLDIPIPVPCDVALFASVRQNDPDLNPTLTDCTALSALSDEDRFLVTYNNFAQYGSIAGSLVFEENLDEDIP